MRTLIAMLCLLPGLIRATEYQLGREATSRQADYDTNRQRSRMDNSLYGNCVLWYSFSRNNGTTNQYDLSRRNVNGTLLNTLTWDSSSGGTWAFTDGTNYLSITNCPSISTFNQLTITAWIKRPATNVVNVILDKWWDGSFRSYSCTICGASALAPGNKASFSVSNTGGSGGYETFIAGGDIPSNQWCFVSATYDGTNMVVSTSAVSVATSTARSGAIKTNTRKPCISADYNGTVYKLILGEIHVFDRAFNPTEMTNFMNATKGTYGL